jgi:hypothetical protein
MYQITSFMYIYIHIHTHTYIYTHAWCLGPDMGIFSRVHLIKVSIKNGSTVLQIFKNILKTNILSLFCADKLNIEVKFCLVYKPRIQLLGL